MGLLTEQRLDELVSQGCTECGSSRLKFRAYLDARVPLMAGEPVGPVTWVYDGEKFVDGVFHVACGDCSRVVFSEQACPRCNTAAGLEEALRTPNQWPVPVGCHTCEDEEVRYVAMVPAEVSYEGRRAEKATTAIDMWDTGFHGVSIDCVDCGVVARVEDATGADVSCPLCAAPGPIRARP